MWHENFGEKYWITESVFKERVFSDIDFFEEGSFVLKIEDKTIGVVVTKINRRNIPDYVDNAWLNLILIDRKFQGNGYGQLLYKRAEDKLKKLGIKKIWLGGDIQHFFSGIPEPDEKKEKFFQKLGFKLWNCHYDLVADVSKIDLDNLDVNVNIDNTYIVREMDKNEISKLNEFFDKNFPGRWKFEINEYLDKFGEFRNIILLLWRDIIIGFCKIRVERDSNGFLGPIGIDKDYRGYKLGNRLLRDSLKYLKVRGTHKVVIDWTSLLDFYGKFGFKPWKTFKGGIKELR